MTTALSREAAYIPGFNPVPNNFDEKPITVSLIPNPAGVMLMNVLKILRGANIRQYKKGMFREKALKAI